METNCLCKMIGDSEINEIKANLPDGQTIDYLSEFFKVFGDSSRLKILYFLSRHELCVADLSTLVEMHQSAVSHQLKILRMNRLVKYRKDGTTIYYALDDAHVQSIFAVALEHIREARF
ncbi:MAG: metalloregulator ArsR/SmtB family transcription factor [Candidatus Cloacimonadaceae bacterium]|nr:metalloregulator ArsR/SmtB family transcription factor [Candidatus Cloacimonadaceae bacterium]MDP3115438.1 metalloregulator ArsR/SmtB family transcription factor [Candidatus Cloacimonadaceae bacterium]